MGRYGAAFIKRALTVAPTLSDPGVRPVRCGPCPGYQDRAVVTSVGAGLNWALVLGRRGGSTKPSREKAKTPQFK